MTAKELAEAHWAWLVTWLKMVYIDAIVHGYGHGYEDGKKDKK